MDFLQNLRLRSLFGGNQPPPTPYQGISFGDTTVDATPPPTDDSMDIPAMMAKIYSPEHAAADNYNNLISNYPTDQRPSFLRTLAAGLTAFGPGGMKAANDVIDEPNMTALADWKNQIGPAQHAAELERQNNVNERTLAYQTVSQQLRAKADEMKNANNVRNTDIKAHRAAVYEFKVTHPNWKLVSPKGGNVIFVNPANPQETMTVTDDNGQPIPSGSLTESDKINLQHENKMEEIGAQGEQARQTEGVRQTGREGIAETRGWKIGSIPDPNDPSKQIGVQYNEITGETKPIQFGGKPSGVITPAGKNPQGNNTGLQKIQQQAQETLAALNEVLEDSGKGDNDQLTSDAADAVGKSRIFGLQYIPGTRTKAGEAAINRLKANLVINLIGEMKAQSRTGATGFGALNIKELGVLEQAASKLDPSLDEETFRKELIRIRSKLKLILQPSSSDNPTVTNAPPAKLDAAALIKKYSVGAP